MLYLTATAGIQTPLLSVAIGIGGGWERGDLVGSGFSFVPCANAQKQCGGYKAAPYVG